MQVHDTSHQVHVLLHLARIYWHFAPTPHRHTIPISFNNTTFHPTITMTISKTHCVHAKNTNDFLTTHLAINDQGHICLHDTNLLHFYQRCNRNNIRLHSPTSERGIKILTTYKSLHPNFQS